MRCDEAADLMDLFLDGELSEDLRRRFEKHLARCADCSHEARHLELARSALREAVERVEPSASFRERAAARLVSELGRPPHSAAAAGRQWELPFERQELSP